MTSAELQRRPTAEDFELLAQVSQMLTTFDRDRLLERVIELTASALGADRASLVIHPQYDGDWSQLFIRHQTNENLTERVEGEEYLHFARRVFDRGLAGWVIRNRQGAVIYDTETDERWYTFPDSTSKARSALCVPLSQGDEVMAALTLLHREPDHFDENDLRLMTIVANQATVAIRNAQLFSRMLEQRRQLEAVLRSIPDVLLVLDEMGQILLVNDEAARLLDEDGEIGHLTGKSLASLAHLDSAFVQIASITSIRAQIGQNWSFETRSEQQRKDFLASVSVWTSSTPTTDRAGYVVIMRDISTMRDLARFKDEMLRMASHDLRSPLALIVGYCDLIALDTTELPQVQEYLQVIQRSTDKMRGLLDDLLRVEQIRNSPLELHQQVDYRDLINTVLNDTRPLVDGKNQKLSAELKLDDLEGIRVNPFLIREAMENLITNAVKYTPEKGEIKVRSYKQIDRLYFIVEDTGVGIPKEAMTRLFQSGFRVRQPGTEKAEGRGLGLSLVKTIIERHDGEVWAESEEGKGSTFGFWIPI
jgi:PAS domain S-box-containing protein